MKRRTLTFFLLFPLLFAAAPRRARAQESNWDAYEPRTLAGLIAKHYNKELDDPKMKDGSAAFGASFPSRVKVTYTGDSRKTSDARREFIGKWIKTYGLDPHVGELFENEWKFVEGGVEHWLPVQKQVASYFEQELKKGDALTLYVVIAGGRKAAGQWDWVILVNEFEKAEATRPAE